LRRRGILAASISINPQDQKITATVMIGEMAAEYIRQDRVASAFTSSEDDHESSTPHHCA
jgi:hypothetical protein